MRASDPSAPVRRFVRGRAAAFTLIEMLAVIAIIGLFVGVAGVALRNRGSESAGLQVAQSVLASTFTLVRSQAAVSGQNSALMVANDPNDARRYLRHVVPVVWDSVNAQWTAISEGYFLPEGCFVVPRNGPDAAAIEAGADWAASPAVRSTALQNTGTAVVNSLAAASEPWVWMTVTPLGTTSDSGRILVATGRFNPPGAAVPFTFTNPDNVRGIAISSYGQFTLLNSRDDLPSS